MISAALIIDNDIQTKELLQQLISKYKLPNVDLHLLYSSDNSNPTVNSTYPVNILRNLALDSVRTEYVLLLDIDWMVSEELYEYIR